MLIFWIVLVVLLLLLFVVGWVLSDFALDPKRNTDEELIDAELARCCMTRPQFDAWPKESLYIDSRYGYKLFLEVCPAEPAEPAPPQKPARVVVLVHGHMANHYAEISFASIFRALGYDVVWYDQRNFGKSDRKLTTMGAREAEDLETVCTWVRARYGQDCILGTQGVSMGGATVMLHSALDHKLAFVIEDCGYSDLMDQLAFVLRTYFHLPKIPLLPLCVVVSWLRTGVWFPSVKPAQAVSNSGQVPMLFIHGADDTYVPFSMLQENYDAKATGPRRMEIFPGAEHAQSLQSDFERYRRVVTEFLKENHCL